MNAAMDEAMDEAQRHAAKCRYLILMNESHATDTAGVDVPFRDLDSSKRPKPGAGTLRGDDGDLDRRLENSQRWVELEHGRRSSIIPAVRELAARIDAAERCFYAKGVVLQSAIYDPVDGAGGMHV